jgi:hypothetical protein
VAKDSYKGYTPFGLPVTDEKAIGMSKSLVVVEVSQEVKDGWWH